MEAPQTVTNPRGTADLSDSRIRSMILAEASHGNET